MHRCPLTVLEFLDMIWRNEWSGKARFVNFQISSVVHSIAFLYGIFRNMIIGN